MVTNQKRASGTTKWKTTLGFAPVTSAQLNRGGLREGSTIRLVVKPPVALGIHHGRNCACVRACVRATESYTTKNFRAQHPAPDAPPPRWHQKDAENLQVAEMTAGCMPGTSGCGNSWHGSSQSFRAPLHSSKLSYQALSPAHSVAHGGGWMLQMRHL